jgi:hypothetical protein
MGIRSLISFLNSGKPDYLLKVWFWSGRSNFTYGHLSQSKLDYLLKFGLVG